MSSSAWLAMLHHISLSVFLGLGRSTANCSFYVYTVLGQVSQLLVGILLFVKRLA